MRSSISARVRGFRAAACFDAADDDDAAGGLLAFADELDAAASERSVGALLDSSLVVARCEAAVEPKPELVSDVASDLRSDAAFAAAEDEEDTLRLLDCALLFSEAPCPDRLLTLLLRELPTPPPPFACDCAAACFRLICLRDS